MQTQTQPKKVGRPKNPYPHVLTPKGFNGWSKAKKREWLLAEIERTKIAKAENLARLVEHKNKNKIEWTPQKPNPKQKIMLDGYLDPKYKIFTFTGGNRSTKTTTGIWLGYATMFGFYPWNPEIKLTFPHNLPRKVRLVGQDWEKHIKSVLEPKLVEWWPQSRPVETKKNNMGVKAFWTDVKTGSTLEILSNQSESDVAEGWDGDLVIYDEPPKRDMRVACARGLIDRLGREYFGMTLLKEAWISREVIKAINADGTPDTSVLNVHATIYDNVGFGITMAGVDQFEKTLTEDEKRARLHGFPSYLSNIIWPINRKEHLRPRFPVPLDWIVDVQIDFHPAKPWAVQFLATTPQNFKWVVEEMWKHGNPKFMAEEIIRSIHRNNYRVGAIEIDPLSKGDSNNDETVFEIMRRTFNSFGYSLRPASKDKDNGIAVVRNWLKSENGMPTLYFFNDLKKTVEQVENWVVDPDTLKPSKVDDDFCECLYRHGLRNTIWFEDAPEEDYQPRYAARNTYTGY